MLEHLVLVHVTWTRYVDTPVSGSWGLLNTPKHRNLHPPHCKSTKLTVGQ